MTIVIKLHNEKIKYLSSENKSLDKLDLNSTNKLSPLSYCLPLRDQKQLKGFTPLSPQKYCLSTEFGRDININTHTYTHSHMRVRLSTIQCET